MSELLPCPFCGGEAKITETEHAWYMNIEHEPTCFYAIEIDDEWMKAKAIEAWNTRATLGSGICQIIPIASGSDMGRCSACGKIADVASNYCWKCGAKNERR